jgi:hypothetical protein
VGRNQRLPGGRYALAALAALSATPLNSAPVQALEVLTWEIVPAADAAISGDNSLRLVSFGNEQEVGFAGCEVKADYFTTRFFNQFPHSRFSILRCR